MLDEVVNETQSRARSRLRGDVAIHLLRARFWTS